MLHQRHARAAHAHTRQRRALAARNAAPAHHANACQPEWKNLATSSPSVLVFSFNRSFSAPPWADHMGRFRFVGKSRGVAYHNTQRSLRARAEMTWRARVQVASISVFVGVCLLAGLVQVRLEWACACQPRANPK